MGARFARGGLCARVNSTTILLVEDDHGLRTFLADNLTADGFDVLLADTVRDAVRLLEYKQPSLALVDVGLPDGSGLDLIARVRAADGVASRLDPGVPLVVLTGRSGELDRVRGFERGADDFVVKPFSYPELVGRVRAILRRMQPRVARAGCGSATSRSTRLRARCGCAGGGWSCPRRSSRCCARWRRRRRACSRRRLRVIAPGGVAGAPCGVTAPELAACPAPTPLIARHLEEVRRIVGETADGPLRACDELAH